MMIQVMIKQQKMVHQLWYSMRLNVVTSVDYSLFLTVCCLYSSLLKLVHVLLIQLQVLNYVVVFPLRIS